MGSSPKTYISARKINASLKDIKNETLTLTEIAYKYGFGNQASFIRTFKKNLNTLPSQVRKGNVDLPVNPIPKVERREFKNFNGDVVVDFTMDYFNIRQLKGVVFEVDLAAQDYKNSIRTTAQAILGCINTDKALPSYMVYSGCKPGSTKFNTLFGVEVDFECNMANVVQASFSPQLCATFKYHGDLLEISDVFTSDFARFLKITKLQTEDTPIELIQVFDPSDPTMNTYTIWVPIEEIDIK
jgi:AraC family transcriptional regulator